MLELPVMKKGKRGPLVMIYDPTIQKLLFCSALDTLTSCQLVTVGQAQGLQP